MKKMKSLFACLLATAMVVGCTPTPTPSTPAKPTETQETKPSTSAQPTAPTVKADNMPLTTKEAEPISLPIAKDKITLSYFSMPEPYVVSKMKGFGDMTSYQVMEEKTNIAIKWREESYTDPKPKMNLMFSTGETEDIIWDAHVHAMGGQAAGASKKLLDEGLIIPLNQYIEDYAPNLKKLLQENPDLLKEISTDDGRIFMFPEIRLNSRLRANSGFQIRQDLLTKYNLTVPTTLDEWYHVLKTFKENDPNSIPFVSLGRNKSSQSMVNFALGFGIIDDMYVDNGVIKYGPMEPQYKEYITMLAKWYKEGLIDPEFSTQDSKGFDAKILDGRGGAYYAALSGNLGKYLNAKKGEGGFDLVGASTPKPLMVIAYAPNRGFARMVPHGASIGANNKHIIETVKWFDYHYSEEGSTLYNWGVEGQSYTVVNGKKQFTDLITKNPEGLSLEEAAAKYAGGVIVQGAFIDEEDVFVQLKLMLPQQKAASDIWSKLDISLLAPDLYYDEAKTKENSAINTEIHLTYANEMFNRFVMGIEPLENYDKFVKTMKDMKIETLIKNTQEAYDLVNKK